MLARMKQVMAGAAVATLLCVASAGPAGAIAFNISWTGADGYTMTGMFSYDDSLINTGPIDETSVDTLMIEGFLNGGSIGTWDLVADGLSAAANFNFNFDTTTEMFLVGGLAASSSGQQWNVINCASHTDMGFFSGSATQGVCHSGVASGEIPVGQSTLTAIRKVPEPATMAILSLGLAGLGFVRRRRAA